MPTEALETVLNRDLSRVAAKNYIETASKLLTELINYATHVFRRCEASSDGSTSDSALLMLYLHMVEMIDGAEVLIAQSCVAPAIPLVRSAFEADLSLRYIFESDSDQRALAWLAAHALEGIQVCDRFDPATAGGKSFQTASTSDPIMKGVPIGQLAASAKGPLAELQKFLNQPEFAPILAARQAVLAASKKKFAKWYSFFGGPKNLRELAHSLQSEGQYLMLYGQWSRVSHAEDYARFTRREKSKDATVRLLRDSSQMWQVTGFAATYLLRATRLMLRKFRPSEDIGEWYLREIQKLLFKTGFESSGKLVI